MTLVRSNNLFHYAPFEADDFWREQSWIVLKWKSHIQKWWMPFRITRWTYDGEPSWAINLWLFAISYQRYGYWEGYDEFDEP
jgi:hypothetical protein